MMFGPPVTLPPPSVSPTPLPPLVDSDDPAFLVLYICHRMAPCPTLDACCHVTIPVSNLLCLATSVDLTGFYPNWKAHIILDRVCDTLQLFSAEYGVDSDHSLLTELTATCFDADVHQWGSFLFFEDPSNLHVMLSTKVLHLHLLDLAPGAHLDLNLYFHGAASRFLWALFIAVHVVLVHDSTSSWSSWC